MFRILATILMMVSLLVSCTQENPIEVKKEQTEIGILTTGQFHNELLARLHVHSDRSMAEADKIDLLLAVTNEVAEEYGESPITRKFVIEQQQLGREIVAYVVENGPFALVDRHLEREDSRLWWRNHIQSLPRVRATLHPDPQVGTLRPASRVEFPQDMPDDPQLQIFVEVTTQSLDYWTDYHDIELLEEGDDPWWMKLAEIVYVALADGAGAAAGAGMGGGPFGAAAGAYIISELAEESLIIDCPQCDGENDGGGDNPGDG